MSESDPSWLVRGGCGFSRVGLCPGPWGWSCSCQTVRAALVTAPTPQAVLAATILVNLKGMLTQITDIRALWGANRPDLVGLGPGVEGAASQPP